MRTTRELKKILVLEIVLVFLAARLFIYTGYTRYSAQTAAKSFFVKVMNADLDGIYNELDIKDDENEFINKEAFLKSFDAMQAVPFEEYKVQEFYSENNFIQKYFIGSVAASQNFSNGTVTIDYTDEEEEAHSMNLQMNIKDTKKFFIFQNWNASAENYIVRDFTISVPKGALVKVDGKELSKEYLKIGEYGNESYVIPQIIKGIVEIKVSKENMEDIIAKVNTAEGIFRAESMKLKPEILQKAVQQAVRDMKYIYMAAFQNTGYTELTKLNILSENNEEISGYYADLAYEIQERNKLSVVTGDIQPETYYYLDEDGRFRIEVYLNFDYSGIYEYEDYWGEEMVKSDYSGYQTSQFVYCLDDSRLLLSSIRDMEL